MHEVGVLSASMFPIILPKDKVIVTKAEILRVNDIVILSKKGRLIAHRLIYISPTFKYLVTKGDGNLASDGRVSRSQILGKVETLIRGTENLNINHIYLAQSSLYLKELKRIDSALKKTGVPYLFLKGLPTQLAINNSPPKRLYLDADILVKKGYFNKASQVLTDLKFKKLKSTLFGKETVLPSQVDFKKFTKPFPVTIDLHISPAIGFTKTRILDHLAPDSSLVSDYLFRNVRLIKVGSSNFPILKNESLLIFLLLHFFHHNFRGIERIHLISEIISNKQLNWKRVKNDIRRLGIGPYTYSSLAFVKKYYPMSIPIIPRSILYSLLAIFISPFESLPKNLERAERFILFLLLSPESLSQKISAILQPEVPIYFFATIRSFFLSSLRKEA